ncbi:hypothetical protein GRX01_03285 [Halobaculum sp. WSA2]|uniref:DUF7344 domain-containing protein n=1 Tax=Halobaculum saliterrae TaxID=2073113 RepID=A0A6B0SWP9_9EURY|nr:hypothetical protein [Halobaculum saliterrae]MXR40380.1 hypothetical protein [Halobaculum saliterrae]
MSSTHTDALSRDEVYDILSNGRRRFVIHLLRDEGEPIQLSELSDRVAAWENDLPVDELTDQQIKRVYVSLYQTHIPKLEESGIVEYDSDSGSVSLTSNVSSLDAYLPEEDRREIPWQTIYLGLAVVGLVVYGVATLAAGAIPQATLNVVGLLVFAAFGVAVAAQYLYEHSRG